MKKLMVTVLAIGMAACGVDSTGDQAAQQVPEEDQAVANILNDQSAIKAKGLVEPRNAACGRAGPNLGNERVNDAAFTGAANQRSGSSTGCVAVGVLQPTDDAIYFCWTLGNDGFTWTYAQNIRTGVRGWTRDNLLRGNGSNFFCGF